MLSSSIPSLLSACRKPFADPRNSPRCFSRVELDVSQEVSSCYRHFHQRLLRSLPSHGNRRRCSPSPLRERPHHWHWGELRITALISVHPSRTFKLTGNRAQPVPERLGQYYPLPRQLRSNSSSRAVGCRLSERDPRRFYQEHGAFLSRFTSPTESC